MLTKTRLMLALVVASVCLAPGVATVAHAASQPRAIPLVGTVTVKANSTASVPVRLTQPVTFSLSGSATTPQIQGDGRVRGVMLVSPTAQDSGQRDFIGFFRFGFCATRACHQVTIPAATQDPGFYSDAAYVAGRFHKWTVDKQGVHVPAGHYLLVIVTDGTPVSATFHLGHGDRTTIIADTPVDSRLNTVVASRTGPTGFVTPTSDTGMTLTGDGRRGWLGFTQSWGDTENEFLTTHPAGGVFAFHDWICAYTGGVNTGAADPYGPGCPAVPKQMDVGKDCTQYYPTGSDWQAWGVPADGFLGVMASCGLDVGPHATLSLGPGESVTATGAGVLMLALHV